MRKGRWGLRQVCSFVINLFITALISLSNLFDLWITNNCTKCRSLQTISQIIILLRNKKSSMYEIVYSRISDSNESVFVKTLRSNMQESITASNCTVKYISQRLKKFHQYYSLFILQAQLFSTMIEDIAKIDINNF